MAHVIGYGIINLKKAAHLLYGRLTRSSNRIYALSSLACQVIRLVLSLFAMSVIPVQEFGAFALCTMLVAVLTLPRGCGLDQGQLFAPEEDPAYFQFLFTFSIVVGGGAALVCMVLAAWFLDGSAIVVLLVGLWALFHGSEKIWYANWVKTESYHHFAVVQFGGVCAWGGVLGIGCVFISGLEALLLAAIAERAFAFVCGLVQHWRVVGFHKGHAAVYNFYRRYFALGFFRSALSSAIENAPVLLLYVCAGVGQLGVYERCAVLFRLPLSGSANLLDAVMVGEIRRALVNGEDVSSVYRGYMSACMLLSHIIYVLAYAFFLSFGGYFFTSFWLDIVSWAWLISGPLLLLLPLYTLIIGYYHATDAPGAIIYCQVLLLVLFGASSLFLVAEWGVVGVWCSLNLAYSVLVFSQLRTTLKS